MPLDSDERARLDELRRRMVAEFPVHRAASARLALWSLAMLATRARAEHPDVAVVCIRVGDGRAGADIDGVLDASGMRLEAASSTLVDDPDVRDALDNLDTASRTVLVTFADEGQDGELRLDVGRILEEITVGAVHAVHPTTWPLAEDEEVLEVGFSYGLTGTRDWGTGAWYFAVREAVADVEVALRAAVADYLATPGSNPNGYAFNWGDAVDEVPDEVWARHGLRPLYIPVSRYLDVDHDETFADDDEQPS